MSEKDAKKLFQRFKNMCLSQEDEVAYFIYEETIEELVDEIRQVHPKLIEEKVHLATFDQIKSARASLLVRGFTEINLDLLDKQKAIKLLRKLKRKVLSSKNEIERSIFEFQISKVIEYSKSPANGLELEVTEFEEFEDFEEVQKSVKKIEIQSFDVLKVDKNKIKEKLSELKKKMANSASEIEFSVYAEEFEYIGVRAMKRPDLNPGDIELEIFEYEDIKEVQKKSEFVPCNESDMAAAKQSMEKLMKLVISSDDEINYSLYSGRVDLCVKILKKKSPEFETPEVLSFKQVKRIQNSSETIKYELKTVKDDQVQDLKDKLVSRVLRSKSREEHLLQTARLEKFVRQLQSTRNIAIVQEKLPEFRDIKKARAKLEKIRIDMSTILSKSDANKKKSAIIKKMLQSKTPIEYAFYEETLKEYFEELTEYAKGITIQRPKLPSFAKMQESLKSAKKVKYDPKSLGQKTLNKVHAELVRRCTTANDETEYSIYEVEIEELVEAVEVEKKELQIPKIQLKRFREIQAKKSKRKSPKFQKQAIKAMSRVQIEQERRQLIKRISRTTDPVEYYLEIEELEEFVKLVTEEKKEVEIEMTEFDSFEETQDCKKKMKKLSFDPKTMTSTDARRKMNQIEETIYITEEETVYELYTEQLEIIVDQFNSSNPSYGLKVPKIATFKQSSSLRKKAKVLGYDLPTMVQTEASKVLQDLESLALRSKNKVEFASYKSQIDKLVNQVKNSRKDLKLSKPKLASFDQLESLKKSLKKPKFDLKTVTLKKLVAEKKRLVKKMSEAQNETLYDIYYEEIEELVEEVTKVRRELKVAIPSKLPFAKFRKIAKKFTNFDFGSKNVSEQEARKKVAKILEKVAESEEEIEFEIYSSELQNYIDRVNRDNKKIKLNSPTLSSFEDFKAIRSKIKRSPYDLKTITQDQLRKTISEITERLNDSATEEEYEFIHVELIQIIEKVNSQRKDLVPPEPKIVNFSALKEIRKNTKVLACDAKSISKDQAILLQSEGIKLASQCKEEVSFSIQMAHLGQCIKKIKSEHKDYDLEEVEPISFK